MEFKRMKRFFKFRSLMGLLLSVLVASCGGGGSGGPEPVVASKIVMGPAAPPSGTVTNSYPGFSFTVASGGSPPFSWSVTAGALPAGLTLSSDGFLTGTPTSAGSFLFTVTATDSVQQTAAAPATVTISVPSPLVVNSTPAPPLGTNGAGYNFTFTATGGYLPLAWTVTAGAAPTGLALGAGGVLSGNPTTAGSYPFTVTVTDSAPTPATSSAAFTVVIDNPTTPVINQGYNYPPPPTGTVGVVYPDFQFSAFGGLAPYIWSESGPLPGLTFSLDGVLSGTPTIAGRFPITVDVKDALNRSALGVPVIVRVSEPRPATFMATGSMAVARSRHTATLLLDGKVLVAGGDGNGSAELYDPASGSFTSTGTMAAARSGHTATLLNSGKVLVVGGGAPTSELYDPATGLFSPTGNLLVARDGQTATLLQNGKVLVAGGGSATAELYDPSTGAFSATGNMTDIRTRHFATLLLDGRVLMIAGGLATAEIYDPVAGVFTAITGLLATGLQAATRLSDGHVLITSNYYTASLLFDPTTDSFAQVGNAINPSHAPTASLLNDGTVLVAGGCIAREAISGHVFCFSQAYAERFAPESEGFTTTDSLITPRDGHTATVLEDGSVLVVGGTQHLVIGCCFTGLVLSSAELYK